MVEIVFDDKVRDKLNAMPRNVAMRIINKVELFVSDPVGYRHMSKKIVNSEKYRLRVGDWRILYEYKQEYFYVSDILPRGSAYKR